MAGNVWALYPTYYSAHARVKYVRGSARDQQCLDCGQPAHHWSYNGTDPNELVVPEGGIPKPGMRYSRDPEFYEPRCRKCHFKLDGLLTTDQNGEKNISAKLTEARVRGIKASVGAPQTEIAEIHGVTQSVVSEIRNGKAWQHVR